jgi:MFS family permease
MKNTTYDWRSIAALNAVSTFAQVGQFGIPFVVLPLWLEQQGATALQISLYAASLWLGQLPGLGVAPRLTRQFGARPTILAALLCSVLALAAIALGISALWLPAGLLAGFGQGLRWIGLEPWLYHIAPSHARGRLVGFHETLIALAPIVAPAMSGWWGIEGLAPLWLGMGFLLVAAVPLLWAHEDSPRAASASVQAPDATPFWQLPREKIFLLGVGVALFGGMSESAFIGLFPVFGSARQLDAAQIASLLASFGLGGLLMQYVAGWLADHRGMGFASLCCCIGTAVVALALTCALGPLLLHAAVFCLGGLVTAYLTLALIASAKTLGGNMARNMSAVSMVYTLSAVVGPLAAAAAMHAVGGNGLMWVIAGFALLMAVYVARVASGRRIA